MIKDEFDPNEIQKEHDDAKDTTVTRIIDGKQVVGNIIFNHVWTKIFH